MNFPSAFVDSPFATDRWQSYNYKEIKEIFWQNNKIFNNDPPIEIIDDTGIYKGLEPRNSGRYFVNIQYKFHIILFISNDGAKIIRAFEKVIPKEDELILFLENNKEDTFSDAQLYSKCGKKVVDEVHNAYDSEAIYNWVNSKTKISQADLEELIENTNNVGFFIWALKKINGVTSSVTAWTFESFSDLFFWIGEKIRLLQIEEQTWQPNNENAISNWLQEKQKQANQFIDNFFGNKTFQLPLPNGFNKNLQAKLKKLVNNAFAQLQQFLKSKLKMALDIAFAFIVGIVNGIIDFLAGIFDCFGLILKLVAIATKSSKSAAEQFKYYKNLMLEYLDNFIQALEKIGWFKVLVKLFIQAELFFLVELPNLLSQININGKTIAYYTGFIGINVLLCFIPITDILQLSKISKLPTALEPLFAKIVKVVSKKQVKIAIKTIDELLNLIDEFLALLNKGTKAIEETISDIFKAIREWLNETFGISKKINTSNYNDLRGIYGEFISKGSSIIKNEYKYYLKKILEEADSKKMKDIFGKDLLKKEIKPIDIEAYLFRRKQMFINSEKGKAFEIIFKKLNGGIKPKSSIKTTFTNRFLDNIKINTAKELKSGYIKMNSRFQIQVKKDIDILARRLSTTINKIEWHIVEGIDEDCLMYMHKLAKEKNVLNKLTIILY